MFAVWLQVSSTTLDVEVALLRCTVDKSSDIHICLEQLFGPPNIRFCLEGLISACHSYLDHEVVCIGCILQ